MDNLPVSLLKADPYLHPLLHRCTSRAWAEIDLDALLWNFSQVKRLISPDCSIMAIVKANAYGHGAFMAAKTLQKAGAACLGVARAGEGVFLRKKGISAPIVVLTGVAEAERELALGHDLIPAVSRTCELPDLNRLAAAHGIKLKVHLKIETGMNRLGVAADRWPEFLAALSQAGHLEVDGLFSHLSKTGPEGERENHEQLERFQRALKQFKETSGIALCASSLPRVHLANSSGVVMNPLYHFNMVRLGLMLYGLPPFPDCKVPLKPVLSWKARIIQQSMVPAGEYVGYERAYKTSRLTRVGVLPVGYADGYSRRLSNRAKVVIGSRPAPVIGNVCMDMLMVDLTDLPVAVQVGTIATLIGREGEIRADRLAALSDTIPYEIVSRIGSRIPRIFIKNKRVVSVEE